MYNLNIESLIDAMLLHALGRRLPGISEQRKIVNIDGFVVRRKTVQPVD